MSLSRDEIEKKAKLEESEPGWVDGLNIEYLNKERIKARSTQIRNRRRNEAGGNREIRGGGRSKKMKRRKNKSKKSKRKTSKRGKK